MRNTNSTTSSRIKPLGPEQFLGQTRRDLNIPTQSSISFQSLPRTRNFERNHVRARLSRSLIRSVKHKRDRIITVKVCTRVHVHQPADIPAGLESMQTHVKRMKSSARDPPPLREKDCFRARRHFPPRIESNLSIHVFFFFLIDSLVVEAFVIDEPTGFRKRVGEKEEVGLDLSNERVSKFRLISINSGGSSHRIYPLDDTDAIDEVLGRGLRCERRFVV